MVYVIWLLNKAFDAVCCYTQISETTRQTLSWYKSAGLHWVQCSYSNSQWYPDRGVCACGDCTHLDVDMFVQRLWAGMCIWGGQSIWCDKMSGFLFLSFKGFLCDQDTLFYFPPFHQLLSVCEQLPETLSMPFQVPTHRDSLSRENGLEVKPLHLNSSALRSVPVWPQTRHSGSLYISSPSGK